MFTLTDIALKDPNIGLEAGYDVHKYIDKDADMDSRYERFQW